MLERLRAILGFASAATRQAHDELMVRCGGEPQRYISPSESMKKRKAKAKAKAARKARRRNRK